MARGPLVFCADLSPDEMTLMELERRAELTREIEVAAMVRQMEFDDPRDRWRHTSEPAPSLAVRTGPFEPLPPRMPEPYRTPRATIDAFKFVAASGDVGRLKAWLADRPKDAPFLLALLESSASC